MLKSNGCITFLDVDSVDWIEAAGVYVYLHIGQNTHLYRSSVTQLLRRLRPGRRALRERAPRRTRIRGNTSRIRELRARSHGDFTVIMRSGTELPLSRAYRSGVEAWLRQPI